CTARAIDQRYAPRVSLVDMGNESKLLVYEATTIGTPYEIMTGKKRYTHPSGHPRSAQPPPLTGLVLATHTLRCFRRLCRKQALATIRLLIDSPPTTIGHIQLLIRRNGAQKLGCSWPGCARIFCCARCNATALLTAGSCSRL